MQDSQMEEKRSTQEAEACCRYCRLCKTKWLSKVAHNYYEGLARGTDCPLAATPPTADSAADSESESEPESESESGPLADWQASQAPGLPGPRESPSRRTRTVSDSGEPESECGGGAAAAAAAESGGAGDSESLPVLPRSGRCHYCPAVARRSAAGTESESESAAADSAGGSRRVRLPPPAPAMASGAARESESLPVTQWHSVPHQAVRVIRLRVTGSRDTAHRCPARRRGGR